MSALLSRANPEETDLSPSFFVAEPFAKSPRRQSRRIITPHVSSVVSHVVRVLRVFHVVRRLSRVASMRAADASASPPRRFSATSAKDSVLNAASACIVR